jgi:hypothetical protein
MNDQVPSEHDNMHLPRWFYLVLLAAAVSVILLAGILFK